MLITSGRSICLIGNAVDEYGRDAFKSIFIRGGKIEDIQSGRVDLDTGQWEIIDLSEADLIFPGFINLHTHTDYNIFPLWTSPVLWKSRHQWRANNEYRTHIKEFKAFIENSWTDHQDLISRAASYIHHDHQLLFKKDLVATQSILAEFLSEVRKMHGIVTELQAVAGGTTLIQQTMDLSKESNEEKSFIIRNTGNLTDLDLIGNKTIESVVDFFRPTPGMSGDPAAANGNTANFATEQRGGLSQFIQEVKGGNQTRLATIAHLAEGRSGNLLPGPDEYSRNEFVAFVDACSKNTIGACLRHANLSLTHVNGINTEDDQHLHFLQDNHISLIWSPVSNLLLYGDTVSAEKLVAAGVNVCLGSDWAPSGSKHVWDELKFAYQLSQNIGRPIPTVELYKMASMNATSALGGLKCGQIQKGFFADFFILRRDVTNQSPMDALINLDDRAVLATIVNGRIVYGSPEIYDKLGVLDYETISKSEGKVAQTKAVSINKQLDFKLGKSLALLDELFGHYTSKVLSEPNLKRTKLLSADDELYRKKIAQVLQMASGRTF
ncbi:MAG: hypothetical protein BGO21_20790 [Dyadobacter sp. 50-39]|uniref:amidohydrolase family protein n=1 Tax=Dyadobacter sp. 50-39 TaxID=1895756 RepID=UPI000962B7EC|nr:amidohydrolase family protein [Dyadobacter sp. 50-39]OJV19145.1 MAG: hypothetical protein BGO21_20790 [Dyadobacter sp. 50-39]